MKKNPLKISWRNWCLYKLAKRDYSSFELTQAILQRAKDSDQIVDPKPVIDQLVSEGIIDDERYVESQIRMQTSGYNIKGPRVIKEKLSQKGGVPDDLISRFLDESDPIWNDLAVKFRSKALSEQNIEPQDSIKIPIKLLQKIKQQLYRKGFNRSQIDYAVAGLSPDFSETKEWESDEVERLIEKLRFSGKGPFGVKQALRQKGIDDELISKCLDPEDDIWIDEAVSALGRKFKSAKSANKGQIRKMIEFLLRRGFNLDQAKQAAQKLV